ncbi:MAG: hypothetical protein JNL11_02725 [Bdellovibrionaceae bacterium]|nr:hypothetical protein [Pseudobdellovibrionaceae bacterium]
MPKFITVFVLFLFSHSLSRGHACDKLFEDMKPRLEALRKVVECGAGTNVIECRENIIAGVGIASAIGTAVGYKTARNITHHTPTACGYRQAYHNVFALFLPTAALAACQPPITTMTDEISATLNDDEKIRRYELGKYLNDKVIADNPQLVTAAKELETIKKYNLDGGVDKTGKKIDDFYIRGLLTDFEKKYGFKPDLKSPFGCTTKSEICNKFSTIRFTKHHGVDLTNFIINDVDHLTKLYPDDALVREKLPGINKVAAIKKKIAIGLYKTPEDLSNILKEAAESVGVAFKDRLSLIAGQAAVAFPTVQAFKSLSGDLKQSFASFLKESKLTKLKTGLPALIAGLIPFATQAADCSGLGKACSQTKEALNTTGKLLDELDPSKVFGIRNLACTEIYSEFSTIDEECKETVAFTPNMKTFLLTDVQTQKNEICKSPTFAEGIRRLYSKTYPTNIQISCDENSVLIKDTRNAMHSRYVFTNNQLTSVSVSGKIGDSRGYIFNFASNGEISAGALNSGGRGTRTPIKIPDLQTGIYATYTEDLSTRLPFAYNSYEQCKNGTITNSFPANSHTPTSPASFTK